MSNFKYILKDLRLHAGLTQQELARKLDISFSSISMYERGKREPNLETLEIIADYFNVDMNYVLGKSEIKNAYAANSAIDENKRVKKENPIKDSLSPKELLLIEKFSAFSEDAQNHILNYVAFLENEQRSRSTSPLSPERVEQLIDYTLDNDPDQSNDSRKASREIHRNERLENRAHK